MYIHDEMDRRLVDDRVAQFRGQSGRFLAGKLTEDEFRPMRLRNGLCIQRGAPMLRVAVPYGLLSTTQLRKLAYIASTYHLGYGHFSTRRNVQFNCPRLEDVPDILTELAAVQMYAMQTFGYSVGNITTGPYGGVARGEIVDSFVWCEVLQQWSTFNAEFSYLPRKFKIAVSGSLAERAAVAVHDVGLRAVRNADGEVGFRVLVGGGLGHTPMIGHIVREFLPWRHLLTYVDAILRVYNRYGRGDNFNRARIKILVKERTLEVFRKEVEAEWAYLKDGPATLTPEDIARAESRFTRPAHATLPAADADLAGTLAADPVFRNWHLRNVHPHKVPGYAVVTLPLKKTGMPPGDVSAEQMNGIADFAERYSFGELRISDQQTLILADVRLSELHALSQDARALGVMAPKTDPLTNVSCCAVNDFCSLANAKSMPVVEAIQRRFDDLDYLHDIGELDVNISGCKNACGHDHTGHIGILGVDKQGAEFYQISIGGAPGDDAAPAKALGPAVSQAEVPDVIGRLINYYIARRDSEEERFIDLVRRIGIEPFKEHVQERLERSGVSLS